MSSACATEHQKIKEPVSSALCCFQGGRLADMCKMRLTTPSRKPEPCLSRSVSKATYSQLLSWGFQLRFLTCFSSKIYFSTPVFADRLIHDEPSVVSSPIQCTAGLLLSHGSADALCLRWTPSSMNFIFKCFICYTWACMCFFVADSIDCFVGLADGSSRQVLSVSFPM